MAEQEHSRFLVWLVGEISNNVTRGLQNVSQNFYASAGLLIVISAQWISQVMGSFDGECTKFRDWIRSTEKHVL